MHRYPCPRCGILRLMSAAEWNKQITCTAPRCGHLFRAPAAPPPVSQAVAPPAAATHRQPRDTRLTNPYLCYACEAELPRATGWRRGGRIVHRLGGSEALCVATCYSEIYLCPGCRVLLETPAAACGGEVICPACARGFCAPVYHLLHETAGDHFEGQVFRFACPACQRRLQCDTMRRGEPTAGLPVACLHCGALIEVPSVGDAVSYKPDA